MVRKHLNGRLANSIGVILAPDGKTKLSKSGRKIEDSDLKKLDTYSKKYPARGDVSQALIPDFAFFKMGLVTASSDQRLLIVIVRKDSQVKQVQKNIAPVVWHKSIQGKFHFDIESDIKKYKDILGNLKGSSNETLLVIEPDAYGAKGKVLKQYSLKDSQVNLVKKLTEFYNDYAKTAKEKSYQDHVRQGKRAGVYLDLPMQLGEDRDGDGKVDDSRRFDQSKEKAKKSGSLIKVTD